MTTTFSLDFRADPEYQTLINNLATRSQLRNLQGVPCETYTILDIFKTYAVYFVKKSYTKFILLWNQFYHNMTVMIFVIILFGFKQRNKLWKKAF